MAVWVRHKRTGELYCVADPLNAAITHRGVDFQAGDRMLIDEWNNVKACGPEEFESDYEKTEYECPIYQWLRE